MPFQCEAMIHSKRTTDTVTILEHKDNNNVTASYNGHVCRAIFNVFIGLYYVDDVYGIIRDDEERV